MSSDTPDANDTNLLLQQLHEGPTQLRDQALAGLLSRYRERLKKMVCVRLDSRLHGRVDPSDVLQEVYLDAAQRLNHYFTSPPPSFLLWLRQLTDQRLVDLHRRHLGAQMRDVRREVSLDGVASASTSAFLFAQLAAMQSSPSQQAMRAEQEQALEQAIARMDPIDQEVLAMRHFEELTNNDVSEILGIQKTTASNRYIRALKRLREVLEDMPGVFDEE